MVALSRRRFVVAGGSALLLGACGGGGGDDEGSDGDGTTTTRGSAVMGDIAILNSALDIENKAIAAYAAGAALLQGRALEAAQLLGEHEREHANELARAIRDLGGKPNPAKKADEHDFPTFTDAEHVLTYALALENTAVAAYIDALPKLSTPELRGTAASIVTNEAEHISLLLGALGKPQVPDAYVVGRKA